MGEPVDFLSYHDNRHPTAPRRLNVDPGRASPRRTPTRSPIPHPRRTRAGLVLRALRRRLKCDAPPPSQTRPARPLCAPPQSRRTPPLLDAPPPSQMRPGVHLHSHPRSALPVPPRTHGHHPRAAAPHGTYLNPNMLPGHADMLPTPSAHPLRAAAAALYVTQASRPPSMRPDTF